MSMQQMKWHFYPLVGANQHGRAFMERLLLEGVSDKTLDAYARAVDGFLSSYPGTDPCRYVDADEADIYVYLNAFKQRRPRKRGRGGLIEGPHDDGLSKVRPLRLGLADSTVAQHVVALRRFYDFLIITGIRATRNPVTRGARGGWGVQPRKGLRVGRQNKCLPWTPPDDVWERFIVHIIQHESPRNRALILLAYYGAIRREEVMLLRYDDIDWSRSLIILRPETTKNGTMRHIPLSGFIEHVLKDYIEGHRQDVLDAYGGDFQGPLFLSESYQNPGHPLSVAAFNAIMQNARDTVGLPLLTPHTLRHQRLTIMRRAGIELSDIALLAGHQSTETTRLYTHIAPTQLGKEIEEKTAPYDAAIRSAIAAHVTTPPASRARRAGASERAQR